MAQIAFPNKQTAVDPNAPASNEIFTADNANEIKQSVNDLYDLTGLTIDPATIDYTQALLNAAYPLAEIGKKIACPFQSGNGPIIYIKVTSTVWYSIPMGTIA